MMNINRPISPSFKALPSLIGLIAFVPINVFSAQETAALPNIVFIMADDLGYNDVGVYGQTVIPTPNLDRLASEGMRLTSAYSPSAVCTPTRYGVLTGTDPVRRYHTSHVMFNAEPLIIEEGEPTVAEILQHSGYTTGVIGKWHLGLGDTLPRDLNTPGRGPNEIGFDYSFIVPDGHNMLPYVYHENGSIVGGELPSADDRAEVLNRLGYKLLQYRDKRDWPNRRPASEIASVLADKADAFIEANKDRPFFLYYPTHAVHTPHISGEQFTGKSSIGPHGDFVMEFDWMVGRVMDKLEALGLAENTLLIVTSDNGGLPSVSGHRPTDPWRGRKGSHYEGGTRVPLIARWPGHIAAGSESSEPVSLVDFFATGAELVDAQLAPQGAADSFTMLPVLRGQESIRPYLVTGTRGITRVAIRKDGWKLIIDPSAEAKDELYYLPDDPQEANDLANQHQERVFELNKLLADYAIAGASRPAAQRNGMSFDKILDQKAERNAKIASVMESENTAAAKQKDNTAPLAFAPSATLEVLRGNSIAVPFAEGETVFIDRDYRILPPPSDLAGYFFFKSSMDAGARVRSTDSGWVFVLTPVQGANADSLAKELLANGFVRTDIAPFHLFRNKPGNLCNLWQKHLDRGDIVDLKKWGLLLIKPENH